VVGMIARRASQATDVHRKVVGPSEKSNMVNGSAVTNDRLEDDLDRNFLVGIVSRKQAVRQAPRTPLRRYGRQLCAKDGR